VAHGQRTRNVNTTHKLKRIIAGALLSGGVAVAGLGVAAGTAQALPDGPHQWCPGQSMQAGEGGPGGTVVWDMNVCHTWYYVGYGQGNVAIPLGFRPAGSEI
jgi:hypothetical protein